MATGIHSTMITELQGLARVHPVFEVTLGATTYQFASEPIASESQGMYLPYIKNWGDIRRSVSLKPISLQTPRTSISIVDDERALQKAIGGPSAGGVLGSTAKIILRSFHVTSGNHYTLIDGVVENYRLSGDREWEFTIEPDVSSLNAENKLPKINIFDFSNCPTDNLGLDTQIVYGGQVSQGITDAAGMVPTICVDSINDWWLLSVGRIVQKYKVYKNGADDTSNWTLEYKIGASGMHYSIVRATGGSPSATDEITVDCQGVETYGDGSTGTLIEDPLEIIENFHSNFVFLTYPQDSVDGMRWIPRTSAPINTTHFDETAIFLGIRNHKTARVITGADKGIDVLNEFCKKFEVAPFWSWDWKLGIRPINMAEVDLYGASLLAQVRNHFLSDVSGNALASKDRITKYIVNYMLIEAQGKFVEQQTVADPIASQVLVATENFEWGKAAI